MRTPLLAAACALSLLSAARAQLAPAAGTPLPRFEDFPAGPAYAGRNRLVLGRADMGYRTMLREAARKRPDFAGHYVLALWGCGTECVMGAAIDVRSGKVAWLPGTLCCWYAGDFDHEPGSAPVEVEPVRYRLDSRLLVLTGRRNERDGDDGEHHYLIEGERFRLLRDVPLARQRR